MTKTLLLSLVIGWAASAQDGIYTTYIPHLADGGGWKTVFTIVNVSEQNQGTGVLRFHATNGAALALPLAGTSGGPVTQVAISLPPFGAVVIETAGAAPNTTVGWAELNDQSLPSALGLAAVYNERLDGGRVYEASVVARPVAPRALVFSFDQREGYATGIAVLNASSLFTGQVSVVVRDDRGTILQTETLSLGAGNQLAFGLAERYPAAGGRRGSVALTPDSLTWLGAASFRFNPAGPFTTLPPMTP